MINLNKETLSNLKRIIGSNISYFSSDMIDFDSKGNLIFRKISVKLNLKNSKVLNILFNCDYRFGFYETYDGSVYYDYQIDKNNFNLHYDKNIYEINFGPVKKIDVYGKIIPKENVVELEKLNDKLFKNCSVSDEVFLFQTIDKVEILLAFDSFFPRIIICFHPGEINRFWENNQDLYSLHHSIM